MRKYILLFAALLFILSGCAENNSKVDSASAPYEIELNGQTLSYYDTEEQIKIENFNILENNPRNAVDKLLY